MEDGYGYMKTSESAVTIATSEALSVVEEHKFEDERTHSSQRTRFAAENIVYVRTIM